MVHQFATIRLKEASKTEKQLAGTGQVLLRHVLVTQIPSTVKYKNSLSCLSKHDTYTLDPIDCSLFKISDLPQLVYNLLRLESKRGFLWLEESYQGDDNLLAVYQCRQPTDLLLMQAFSQLLISRICDVYEAPITTYGSSLHELRSKHYEFLNRQRNVVKLIMIDLSLGMEYVTNTRILSSFNNSSCKGIVYNLVKQI
jgi:hypothetical protein